MADAIQAASHVYQVVDENDRVRVLEGRAKPGDRTEMHTHPAQVAVAVTDGKFRFTGPDGHSVEVEMQAGQAMYLDATEHATENVGTNEARIVLVELK